MSHSASGSVSVFHARAREVERQAETSHTDHVITYLAAGEVEFERGSVVKVPAGACTVVPAGVPHRVLGARRADLWLVSFCAGCLELDEAQPLMAPFRRVRLGALPIVELSKKRQARVRRVFRELLAESERVDAVALAVQRSLVTILLGELVRAQAPGSVDQPTGGLVGDALLYIQRHCLEPISLRDVAAAVHRTPTHVAAKVKAATGHSVGAWINAGRVAEAATRLAHTDDDLDAIAEHVGWQDKTHFIRQFKKAYDVTPAAWRRAQRRVHVR